MITEDDIIDDIIRREGRTFTDHPADKGGPTKFGITLATLRRWRQDAALGANAVRALLEPEAREIYRADYVRRPGFRRLADHRLRVQLIDWGVTSKSTNVVREFQRVLRVKDDGILGPITAAAANEWPTKRALRNKVAVARCRYYAKLARDDLRQCVFILGWITRATDFIE